MTPTVSRVFPVSLALLPLPLAGEGGGEGLLSTTAAARRPSLAVRVRACKPGPLRGLAACAISKVAPDQAIGLIWPHLGALFLALIVIAVFPWILISFL